LSCTKIAAFTEHMQRDDGTDVVVEFTQSQYHPATGPSWDSPCEPAEGGEIEILAVYEMGAEVWVTAQELDRFYDELYSLPPRRHEPDPDYLYDRARDDAWQSSNDGLDGLDI